MFIPSFEELHDKTDSRYSMVMLIAKRAREIIEGKEPFIEVEANSNPVTVAFMEVMDGSVKFGEEDLESIESADEDERTEE